MVCVDVTTIAVAAILLPFNNLWLLSVPLILIGLPLGARPAVAEARGGVQALLIGVTFALIFGSIYGVFFYGLNTYGS